MDTGEIWLTVLCVLLAVFCFPFSLLTCYTIYKDWDSLYLVKRHRKLVLLGTINLMYILFGMLITTTSHARARASE